MSMIKSMRVAMTVLAATVMSGFSATTNLSEASDLAPLPAAAAVPPFSPNPSFERGLLGWTRVGNGAAVSSISSGRSGKAIRLSHTAISRSTVGIRTQPAPAAAAPVRGRRYSATAWVRANSVGTPVTVALQETGGTASRTNGKVATQVLNDTAWHEIGVTYVSTGRGRYLNLTITARLWQQRVVDVDMTSNSEMSMQWQDEFNGSAIERKNWNVFDHSNFGLAHGSFPCLMDRPANVRVSKGALWITARRETPTLLCEASDPGFPKGRSYSSGHLYTRGLASWRYAYLEMNARLPITPRVSQGAWPAFWMRPTDRGLGEIDILEAYGSRPQDPVSSVVHHNLHHDYSVPRQIASVGMQYPVLGKHPSASYHKYAVHWSGSAIRWFVDDVLANSVDAISHPWIVTTFNRDMFMRINLAVGNRNMPVTLPNTTFPQTMWVDYVRVYQ